MGQIVRAMVLNKKRSLWTGLTEEKASQGAYTRAGFEAELAVIKRQEGVVGLGDAFSCCHCCPLGESEKGLVC